MPELAEVEYFRKRWDAGLGARIVRLQLHEEKRVFRGTDVAALKRQLVRQEYLRSAARGKQMLFQFSGGNWLGLHLGMSGNLRVEPPGFRAEKHDHLVLELKKSVLVFRDARQFGRVRFHHGAVAPVWWEASAPQIHSRPWTKIFLRKFLTRHARAPIKAVLLLQQGFPGIGNWMADEILWRARLAPQAPAGKLSAAKINALWRETRFVVRAALKSIARDYGDPPNDWLLHERWKQDGKCPRDGNKLRRATIGGRTTKWCAKCQR